MNFAVITTTLLPETFGLRLFFFSLRSGSVFGVRNLQIIQIRMCDRGMNVMLSWSVCSRWHVTETCLWTVCNWDTTMITCRLGYMHKINNHPLSLNCDPNFCFHVSNKCPKSNYHLMCIHCLEIH